MLALLLVLAAAPEVLPAETITLEVGQTRTFKVGRLERIAVSGCSVMDFDVRTVGNDVVEVRAVRETKGCPLLMWSAGQRLMRTVVITAKIEHREPVLEARAEGVLLRLEGVRAVKVMSGEGVTARVVPEGVMLSCQTRGAVVLRVDQGAEPVTYEVDLRRLP